MYSAIADTQKCAFYIDPISPSLPFVKLECFCGNIMNRCGCFDEFSGSLDLGTFLI